jgi:hypothetical protein
MGVTFDVERSTMYLKKWWTRKGSQALALSDEGVALSIVNVSACR